ncbi:MAG TPA: hypothetical protein H9805_10275 [Candidatus Janibacter merdipullorum]|nr:hypothetical protein [Candidatus Janibacter merdipullorum]
MTRIRTTISTTAGLALLGAGLTAPTSVATTAAAPDACADAGSSCHIVSRADVDGDDRRDSVGLTAWGKSDHGYKATVRVRTADGESLTTVSPIDLPQVSAWWGAAAIDGEPGHELVLQSDEGAHTGWYHVITYRDGKLTTLKDPLSTRDFSYRYRWAIDSSATTGMGYRRTVMSSGKPLVYAYRGTLNRYSGRYVQTTKAVTWSNGGWRQISKKSASVTPAVMVANAEWNVPYLPQRH